MKLTVAGCSPAWPNPGGAQSGYLVENGSGTVLLDCGPGVLARLRQSESWPEPDAIVITHFHLDHWGDLVPWVWGALYLDGQGVKLPSRCSGCRRAARRVLEHFGSLLGFQDMFERVFSIAEYTAGSRVRRRWLRRHRDASSRTTGVEAHALRVTAGGRTLAYSGDSGPSDGARLGCERRRSVPLRGDAPRRRPRRRAARPPVARRGARDVRGSGRQGACSSRTGRSSWTRPRARARLRRPRSFCLTAICSRAWRRRPWS